MSDFEEREKLPIQIFNATLEDVADIIAVQKETWLSTYPNEEYGITTEDILSKDWDNPDRLARWQKTIVEGDGTSQIWVAKDGERVVGFCSAAREGNRNRNRIRAIYVLPECQGRGIGKQLMQKAFSWLGDEKDTAVAVVKYNANAIDFYKKSGFQGEQEIPPSPAGQLPSGKLMPEIEMLKPRKD